MKAIVKMRTPKVVPDAIQCNTDQLSHARLKNGEKENLVIDAPSTFKLLKYAKLTHFFFKHLVNKPDFRDPFVGASGVLLCITMSLIIFCKAGEECLAGFLVL